MNLTRKQLVELENEVGPQPIRMTVRRGSGDPGDEVVILESIDMKPEPEYSAWLAKLRQRAIEKYGAAE